MRGENPGTLCGKNKDIPGSTRKGCKTCPDTLWFTLMPFLLSFVVEVADTLSRIVFRSFSLSLLLLAASGTIRAQAQDPFTQNRLPDLGMMPVSHEGEKHFAEMAKAFGEASMKNNDLRHSGSSAAIVSPAVICGFLSRVYCWRFASGCYSAQWR